MCRYIYIYICILFVSSFIFGEGTSVISVGVEGLGQQSRSWKRWRRSWKKQSWYPSRSRKMRGRLPRFWREVGSDGFFSNHDFDGIVSISGTEKLCCWFDNRTCHFLLLVHGRTFHFFRKAFHSRKTSTIYNEHCFQSPLAFEIVTTTFKTKQVEFWHLDLITRFKPSKHDMCLKDKYIISALVSTWLVMYGWDLRSGDGPPKSPDSVASLEITPAYWEPWNITRWSTGWVNFGIVSLIFFSFSSHFMTWSLPLREKNANMFLKWPDISTKSKNCS